MVLMDEVWSETTATIAARPRLFAVLALGLFVPPVLHAGWLLATTAPGALPSPSATSMFALLTTVIALWAQLAIVAAALAAPGHDAAQAGLRRLLPALGIELLVAVLLGLLLVPLIAVAVRSGVDLQAMSSGDGASLSPAGTGVAIVSIIVFLVVAIIAGARLLLTIPVIVTERRGLGALGRSWRLTRGLTWRIVGVVVLFTVVIGVAVLAAQSVSGTMAALIAGTDSGVSAFVAAIAGAAVTAALGIVAIVFTARLWRTLDARRPA